MKSALGVTTILVVIGRLLVVHIGASRFCPDV
jgi:hypothetical protein